jgi:hypothetical protein
MSEENTITGAVRSQGLIPYQSETGKTEPVRDIALIIAQALLDAGYELGALGGMTGEEEVLMDDAVQYWRPGQKDIDGTIVDHPAAQTVALGYRSPRPGPADFMVYIHIDGDTPEFWQGPAPDPETKP